MNKYLALIISCFLLISCRSKSNFDLDYSNPNLFINEKLGVMIEKPENWHFIGHDTYKEARKVLKFNDEEMNRRKNSMTNMPSVTLSKYPAGSTDKNSTCEFLVKDISKIRSKSEEEIWDMILPTFKTTFKDFALVKAPYKKQLSSITTSAIEISLTVETIYGDLGPHTSKMMIWKKGRKLYQLVFTYPKDSKLDVVEEIDFIMNNFTILY